MIEAVGLSKSFQSEVIAEVSFSIGVGQRCCLLGPNGVGKTTLLKLMAGLVRPSGGQVRVGGQDLANNPQARRAVGFVAAEARGFYERLTVWQNLQFFLSCLGMPQALKQGRAELERWLPPAWWHKPYQSLSAGAQVRVSLALTHLRHVPYLLLDEPLRSLDRAGRQCFYEWFQQSRAQTWVVATHQRELADQADQWLVFSPDKRLIRVHPRDPAAAAVREGLQ
jgi:ABC-type multidrug transport system ATPase subunit